MQSVSEISEVGSVRRASTTKPVRCEHMVLVHGRDRGRAERAVRSGGERKAAQEERGRQERGSVRSRGKPWRDEVSGARAAESANNDRRAVSLPSSRKLQALAPPSPVPMLAPIPTGALQLRVLPAPPPLQGRADRLRALSGPHEQVPAHLAPLRDFPTDAPHGRYGHSPHLRPSSPRASSHAASEGMAALHFLPGPGLARDRLAAAHPAPSRRQQQKHPRGDAAASAAASRALLRPHRAPNPGCHLSPPQSLGRSSPALL
mmetsp:Transcript_33581/g.49284  ORF Transcript_33581/g.49284 Transcript_33581/m.49284 type:complete len:261 (+) Transcript_33581:125-907(+)